MGAQFPGPDLAGQLALKEISMEPQCLQSSFSAKLVEEILERSIRNHVY